MMVKKLGLHLIDTEAYGADAVKKSYIVSPTSYFWM
jgi:hypothetical protein